MSTLITNQPSLLKHTRSLADPASGNAKYLRYIVMRKNDSIGRDAISHEQ
jgi:hypothetical protein